MTDQQPKEFRLKGGNAILDDIHRFSATEKAVFGAFAIAAIVTALIMVSRVNGYFLKEIPIDGGTLREGLVGLPHAVNPVISVTDADRDISTLVYAGLVKFVDGAVVPDLASDWKVSADGLTYTFNLRPDLKFQDGAPLTADDVVFTIQKIQDTALKSPRAADWAGIVATSSSPLTVEFILKRPYSSFLPNTAVGVIPKHIWSKVSDDQFLFSEYNIEPVGAGPYKVGSVVRDQGGIPTSYRLSAWSGYHDPKPHVSDIVFSFFPDEGHAVTALENGAIDSLPSISPANAKALGTNGGEPYTIVSAPLTRIFGVFFNQNQNLVLADAAVRHALDTAVDRDAIVRSVLDGYASPIGSPLPPGLSASTTPAGPADLVDARVFLTNDGWKLGADGIYAKKANKKSATTTLSFVLYTADSPDLKATADLLKSQWGKLGAAVTVKVFEQGDLYQNVIRTRSYDALLFGEAMGKNNDLFPFWHSSERNAPGLNIAMYTNSKADKLLEQIRVATDTDAKAQEFAQLGSLITADDPAVFLYAPDFIYAVPKSLQGLELGTLVTPADRFAQVKDWYVETERVWNFFAN